MDTLSRSISLFSQFRTENRFRLFLEFLSTSRTTRGTHNGPSRGFSNRAQLPFFTPTKRIMPSGDGVKPVMSLSKA
jgi:hypothetical protein